MPLTCCWWRRVQIFQFWAAVCFLLTGFAGISRASISSCADTVGNISGNAGANPPGGCGLFDLGFSAFSVGNLGDGSQVPPNNTQVNLSTSGGTAGSTTTMAPIDLTFSSTGWSVTSNSTPGPDCSGSCNELSGFATFFASPVGGEAPPSDGGSWGISGVALPLTSILGISATGTGIPSNAFIEVDLLVCVGVAQESDCGPGNQAAIEANGSYNGSTIALSFFNIDCESIGPNCNNNNNQLNFTVPYSQVFIDGANVFVIAPTATGGGSYTVSLSSFNAEFDQVDTQSGVPEPGTLSLIGAGLLAIAGVGRKRMALRGSFRRAV